jgi:hypothetical protein
MGQYVRTKRYTGRNVCDGRNCPRGDIFNGEISIGRNVLGAIVHRQNVQRGESIGCKFYGVQLRDVNILGRIVTKRVVVGRMSWGKVSRA